VAAHGRLRFIAPILGNSVEKRGPFRALGLARPGSFNDAGSAETFKVFKHGGLRAHLDRRRAGSARPDGRDRTRSINSFADDLARPAWSHGEGTASPLARNWSDPFGRRPSLPDRRIQPWSSVGAGRRASPPAPTRRRHRSTPPLGRANLRIPSVHLQGFDDYESSTPVHARPAPMLPASAGLLR
jgi:hypothetical protein